MTFDKVSSIAIAAETANKNAQDLQNLGATAKCFKVNKGSDEAGEFKGPTRECYRCESQHTASECKFKQEKCHACGRVQHIARACRNKNTQNKWNKKSADVKSKKGQSSNYHSHKVKEKQEDSSTDSSEESTFTLKCMKFKLGHMSEVLLRKIDPYTVRIQINGKSVTFEIDTSCSLTVMNEKTFHVIGC